VEKKGSRRLKKKTSQIYWVESAYFFSLSATAEGEEFPQINQRIFFFFDQREKKAHAD
jgi:hypothetical protein